MQGKGSAHRGNLALKIFKAGLGPKQFYEVGPLAKIQEKLVGYPTARIESVELNQAVSVATQQVGAPRAKGGEGGIHSPEFHKHLALVAANQGFLADHCTESGHFGHGAQGIKVDQGMLSLGRRQGVGRVNAIVGAADHAFKAVEPSQHHKHGSGSDRYSEGREARNPLGEFASAQQPPAQFRTARAHYLIGFSPPSRRSRSILASYSMESSAKYCRLGITRSWWRTRPASSFLMRGASSLM